MQDIISEAVKHQRNARRHILNCFTAGLAVGLSMVMAVGHFAGLAVLPSLWMVLVPIAVAIVGLLIFYSYGAIIGLAVGATVALALAATMVVGFLLMAVATGVGKVIPPIRGAMNSFVNGVDYVVTNLLDGTERILKNLQAKYAHA